MTDTPHDTTDVNSRIGYDTTDPKDWAKALAEAIEDNPEQMVGAEAFVGWFAAAIEAGYLKALRDFPDQRVHAVRS